MLDRVPTVPFPRRTAAPAIGVAAIAGLMALAPPAAAEDGMEVRVGLTAHNIQVIDDKNADKEDGPNVSVELSFESPEWLAWLGAPRPYVTASGNTAGATSFGGAGVEWRFGLGGGWSIDPGFGYVIHDGAVKNPFPSGDPRAVAHSSKNVLLGSRDLFRTSLAASWRQEGGPWGLQVLYEHLSHGQILGKGRNQGLDNLGLRVAYRFGG